MKKALKIILNIVIWVFVVFSVIVSTFVFSANSNSDGYPDLFDKLFIPVSTDNVSVSINKGDLLIADKINEDYVKNLKPGDTIIFSANISPEEKEKVIIGKITEILYKDNDVAYKFENIESVLFNANGIRVIALYNGNRIIGMGNIVAFLVTPTGFISIVVIPLMLIFLFELFNYITEILSSRSMQRINKDEEEIKRKAIEEFISKQEKNKITNNMKVSENISDKE